MLRTSSNITETRQICFRALDSLGFILRAVHIASQMNYLFLKANMFETTFPPQIFIPTTSERKANAAAEKFGMLVLEMIILE